MRHPATHPGRCALTGVPFSEQTSKGLTEDTHGVHTLEQDLAGRGRREATGHGFSGGEAYNPESKGLELQCFQVL